MKNIKRTLAILLILTLIMVLLLPGCGKKEAGPLRICLDVGTAGSITDSSSNSRAVFENLLKTMEDFGGPKDVEVEYIPAEGADRKSMIKHLKTELMSGSGPDLFIVDAYDGNFYDDEPIFTIPEQMIERHVFLPLDEYIEKAQFADWDRLTPKVMEAGRGSEGQILVPLAYTLPLTCYKAEDYAHTPSPELTWMDMLASDDMMFRQSAFYGRPGERSFSPSFNFGQLADYKEEELLFTGEELLDVVEQELTLLGEYQAGSWDELPTCYQGMMSPDFWPSHNDLGSYTMDTLRPETPMAMVPLYNKEGGLTAKVTTFAAINRNTKRAGEAFFALDYLLGRDTIQYSDFYKWVIRLGDAMVMDMDVGKEDYSYRHQSMAPENVEQFDLLRDSITSVSFANILDHEMEQAYIDAYMALYEDGGDSVKSLADIPTLSTCSPEARERIRELVKEAYRVMAMELQES